jgi:hypothetical protein
MHSCLKPSGIVPEGADMLGR